MHTPRSTHAERPCRVAMADVRVRFMGAEGLGAKRCKLPRASTVRDVRHKIVELYGLRGKPSELVVGTSDVLLVGPHLRSSPLDLQAGPGVTKWSTLADVGITVRAVWVCCLCAEACAHCHVPFPSRARVYATLCPTGQVGRHLLLSREPPR